MDEKEMVLNKRDECRIARHIELSRKELYDRYGKEISEGTLSPEAVESVMEALSHGIRQAKIINKKNIRLRSIGSKKGYCDIPNLYCLFLAFIA
jgi:hypothetical protein